MDGPCPPLEESALTGSILNFRIDFFVRNGIRWTPAARSNLKYKKTALRLFFYFENHCLGADLLSPNGLPSALTGLTSEFGMGSGGPPPLEAPRQ